MARSTAISVIVPVLDEATALPETLASLRGLGDGIEIIVVDGGSSDGSQQIAERSGASQVLQTTAGRGCQLRRGADAAQGDVLWFVHADGRLPASALERVRETVDSGYDGGAFRIRHRPSADASRSARWWLRLADLRARGGRLPYGDQALFLTRAAYERCGGMPDQPLMEDVELGRRLKKQGCRLRRLADTVEVSSRRFESAPLRTMLCWSTFPALYTCGVPPETLQRWYGRGRRRSTATQVRPR